MGKGYRLQSAAVEDIHCIRRRLHDLSPAAAERFGDRLADALENLGTFPSMGSPRKNLSDELRAVPLNGYSVYYRVEEGVAIVLAVMSDREDPKRILGRL